MKMEETEGSRLDRDCDDLDDDNARKSAVGNSVNNDEATFFQKSYRQNGKTELSCRSCCLNC